MSNMFQPDPAFGQFIDPWVLGEIRSFLESDPPRVSLQRLTGRSLVVADPQFVATQESTTSTSYTDLTTAGPTQDSLPPGKYIFFFGAIAKISTAGDAAKMSLNINGTVSEDTFVAQTDLDRFHSIMAIQFVTLSNDNNSVVCQYKSSVGTSTAGFQARWIASLRYSD